MVFEKERNDTMNHIHAIIHALKAAEVKAQYYNKIEDPRYLQETMDWIQVANIYLEQLKCES
jgi:hypothetical protein